MKQRLISTILLRDRLAYVSRRFGEYHYVGDPVNILNILSAYCVDEVMIVDTSASRSNHIDRFFLEKLRSVSDFPLAYAGGLREESQIDIVFRTGFDKIFLSACNSDLVRLAEYTQQMYGSQALGLSLDYSFDSQERIVFNPYSRKPTKHALMAYLLSLPAEVFSDILLTSVLLNGTSSGIDVDVLHLLASSGLRNPILLSGGLKHFSPSLAARLIEKNPHFSGVAASTSIFLQNYSYGSALVSLKRHEF